MKLIICVKLICRIVEFTISLSLLRKLKSPPERTQSCHVGLPWRVLSPLVWASRLPCPGCPRATWLSPVGPRRTSSTSRNLRPPHGDPRACAESTRSQATLPTLTGQRSVPTRLTLVSPLVSPPGCFTSHPVSPTYHSFTYTLSQLPPCVKSRVSMDFTKCLRNSPQTYLLYLLAVCEPGLERERERKREKVRKRERETIR